MKLSDILALILSSSHTISLHNFENFIPVCHRYIWRQKEIWFLNRYSKSTRSSSTRSTNATRSAYAPNTDDASDATTSDGWTESSSAHVATQPTGAPATAPTAHGWWPTDAYFKTGKSYRNTNDAASRAAHDDERTVVDATTASAAPAADVDRSKSAAQSVLRLLSRRFVAK